MDLVNDGKETWHEKRKQDLVEFDPELANADEWEIRLAMSHETQQFSECLWRISHTNGKGR
jgi:hypothetical protein